MKLSKAAVITAVTVLILSATVITAAAASDPEASRFSSKETYTLQEMLTYAIEDEYLARAQYEAIIDEWGASRPFANIVKAEETHIALLLPLFEAYDVPLPEDNAAQNVTLPSTWQEAKDLGVQAEIANIEMYETFLAQGNVPDDVEAVFTQLTAASQNHLAAFQKAGGVGKGSRLGDGTGISCRNNACRSNACTLNNPDD